MYKDKKIIYIYGASGAGSTTLGSKIVEKYNGILIDTDEYFWNNDTPEKRYQSMLKDIKEANSNLVVITGSFWNWDYDYSELINYIDKFVRVMLDKNIRLERLQKREEARYGDRIKEGGDLYNKHTEFIKWASFYDDGDLSTRSLASHKYFEEKYNVTPIIIDSKNEIEYNLSCIL